MLLWIAAILFGIWLVGVPALALGIRALQHVRDLPLPEPVNLPLVSVVIAARDEADGIERALTSVLALDYPALEVIVVDDRSTDGTGDVLDRMAQQQPNTAVSLRVIHNHALPEHWLGKNHALQLGAAQSSGELILFSDADIVFAPATMLQAVG